MEISGLHLKPAENKTRIQADVKYNGSNSVKTLWFEFRQKYKDFLTHDRYDGFIAALLSSAMMRGEPIHVGGAVSESLYKSLYAYMRGVNAFCPHFKIVDIYAHEAIKKKCAPKGAVGASFMLSTDSLNVIQSSFTLIDYLVYANLGGHYPGNITPPSFKERAKTMTEANDTYLHKELIVIDSNIETFFTPGTVRDIDIEFTFGTMTIGAALLLQGLLAKYCAPLTVNNNLSTMDLIPLPKQIALTESLELIHVNPRDFEGKQPELIRLGLAKPILNVCGNGAPGVNPPPCSELKCRKCISALINSHMPGYRELFFNVYGNPASPASEKKNREQVGIEKSENLDVSVILPFYKKYNDFVRVLPLNAAYFSRSGVEVLIVMDESSEEEQVLAYIEQYPQINWVVIVNDNDHEWRNPAKTLNVGIKHAAKKYILIISPESEMKTDIIRQFTRQIENNRSYCIGLVHFLDYCETRFFIDGPPYGSIMVSRDNLVKIGGYDESFDKWGGEDDNLRSRLNMIGVRETLLPEAHIIHREEKSVKRTPIKRGHPLFNRVFFPISQLANNGHFGSDFKRIAYHYTGQGVGP
jgi:GT2 family glycosyltransferase